MNAHRKANRGLATLAGHYADRWEELSELPPEDLCDFLCAEGWTWNPNTGQLGRWEQNNGTEGEESNGKEGM